jgi:F-type H+-transporting ATPase subunit epsilon
MNVHVITPERTLPVLPANHVTFTAVDGEVGVRPGHAPLVAQLAVGFALVRAADGTETLLAIRGGVAQVLNNEVKLFTEQAEDVNHIDMDKIQKRLEQLGSAKPATAHERARNEAEATWNLLQMSLATQKKS